MFIHKISRSLRFVVMALVAMTLSLSAWAQNISVSGTVTDVNGEPIIGAYVLVQGTSTGTSTDVDGKYQLSVPSNGTLVFTMVGMKDAVVAVNGKAVVNVTMQEDAEMLEEVVMVAYGSQKKENLSGAVSSINVGKTLESRPLTDVGRALQGSTPGLIVTTTSGALGGSPTIKIRGTSSTLGGGSGNPLILVDNVEVPDLSYVNPDDIESISTLKDASTTSIYGARAAFGAILITTKKGSKDGQVKVNYSSNFAWATMTTMPEFTRADLAQQYSLDQVNGLNAVPVSQIQPYAGYLITTAGIAKTKEWIDKYGNGEGLGREMVEGRDFDYQNVTGPAMYYRPWDVQDLFYKDWAPQQNHNLSVNGGNEKMQYNLSAGLMTQKGILKQFNDFYNRKSVSANLSSKVHDRITLRGGFMFTNTVQEDPMSFYESGTDAQTDIYSQTYYLYRWHTVNPYGTYNGKEFRNGISEFMQAKAKVTENTYSRVNLGASIDILEGLKANFDYTYTQTNVFTHRQGGNATAIDIFSTIPAGSTFDDMYKTYTTSGYANSATYDSSKNMRNAYNGNISYENSFGKHNVKAMVGTNIEDAEYVYHRSKRLHLIDPSKPEPNLANGTQSIASSHSWWSVAGIFARVNYDYNGKYLIEGNIRYDESSKFAKGSRGGWFPSFSAAWRVTEEPWMQGAKNVMNSLKLRGSYGVIGNQDVPLGSYIPSISISTPSKGTSYWLVNGAYVPQVSSAAALVDPALTWEKVSTLDFGVDARFWKDKIGLTFDWYQRKTMDMLSAGDVIPSSVGASAPKQNFGELTTNGVELELSFNHQFENGLRINVGANYSDYTTVISKWAYVEDPLYSNNYQGKRLGDIWGYKADGLWQIDDFVYDANGKIQTETVNGKVTNVFKNHKAGYQALYESGSFRFSPGDVKFKDLNGDGVINYGKSTLSDHGDLAVIGNTQPRHLYGFRLGANWMGFDFDIFFQGVGKREMWVTGNMVLPGWQALEANFAHTLDYWTPENTDAFYPRPIQYGNGQKWNYQTSDRYLMDMAYLRCKSATLGYSFPTKLLKKVNVNRLRIYASGENLFEFDHLGNNPIDPEMQNTTQTSGDARAFGRAYPYRRSVSFGIQLDF